MNRTPALDRDRAAPSSPASTANRMTATESLLPEIINDFFNKIGTFLPSAEAASCPQLAEADVRPPRRKSGFAPEGDISRIEIPHSSEPDLILAIRYAFADSLAGAADEIQSIKAAPIHYAARGRGRSPA